MKKILIAIGLIVVYTALYIFSHKFSGLFMLPFLILPSLISISFFDKRKYSISFLLSGMFVFPLSFIIGGDNYSDLLNIDFNAYLSMFYIILGSVFIVAGIVSGLVKLVMFSMRKPKL